MKPCYLFVCAILLVTSCEVKTKVSQKPIEGTWKLLSGTLIEKGDTTTTDYTASLEMIKVINATHFSFLNHDKNKGSDSTASFAAGGGKYSLKENQYTEFLEYCTDRQWEGHEFKFTVEIKDDTLIQSGTELVENLGINRMNIEKYVRIKE
jgi:hypothetical protein